MYVRNRVNFRDLGQTRITKVMKTRAKKAFIRFDNFPNKHFRLMLDYKYIQKDEVPVSRTKGLRTAPKKTRQH